MSIGDSRCDECDSKELSPFTGEVAHHRVCLCRRCIGKAVQAMLRYIRGFDRDHPRPKKPRNQSTPVTDLFGSTRCRGCEAQIHDFQPGASPYCDPCRESQSEQSMPAHRTTHAGVDAPVGRQHYDPGTSTPRTGTPLGSGRR